MALPEHVAKIVKQTRALGIKLYPSTAHPDEVLQIPSRDEDRTIRVHAYNTLKRESPAPVLINFPGGGFMVPLLGSDDEYAQAIVQKTDYMVLDCSYRLAPENPWPAAVHDAEDVVRWVLSHPEKFSPSHISISGFSAGGSLALIMSAVVFPPKTFRHVVSFYTGTDLSKGAKEIAGPKPSEEFTPTDLMNLFISCYLPSPEDRKSWLASPAFIPVEKFSDRILFVTGSSDALGPEAEELGQRIKDSTDKHVEIVRYEDCDHAFDKLYEKGSVQEKAKDDMHDKVASFLSQ
ncbi:Alpha/Beta hydrolase protein [Aspergillus avenaceus]|uniref:Alpha/Beta hydrolase protein n=1 Tax=Aspergillus avenaceus TaxID=36643 RepID=A0A5N6TW38_ASPAV|nr:Alpha/Beta hydrolase protein [Aspergillus avenaceus]